MHTLIVLGLGNKYLKTTLLFNKLLDSIAKELITNVF